jgi:RNA polymerase sigma factor (sigma-70 family)
VTVEELIRWAQRRAAQLPDRVAERAYDGFMARAVPDLPLVLTSSRVRNVRWRQARIDALTRLSNSRVWYQAFDHPTATDADNLERVELYAALHHALGTLSERESTIVRLYYFEGLPLLEVSERLGLAYANTKVSHWRALRRLASLPALRRFA